MQRSPRRASAASLLLAVVVAIGSACTSTATTGTTTTGSSAASTTSTSPSGTTDLAAATDGTAVAGTTPSTGASTSTTRAGGGSSTTTATAPPSTSGASTTAVPSTTGPVAPEDAAFCAEVTTAQGELSKLDPVKDPEAALAGYKKVLSALANLAPASIRADVLVVQGAVAGAKTWQDLQAAGTPAVVAASDRVDAWTTAHCGTTLGGA